MLLIINMFLGFISFVGMIICTILEFPEVGFSVFTVYIIWVGVVKFIETDEELKGTVVAIIAALFFSVAIGFLLGLLVFDISILRSALLSASVMAFIGATSSLVKIIKEDNIKGKIENHDETVTC